MEELYQIIEAKIRASGYSGAVDPREIYHEISDEIEDKEPGSYVFMSKKDHHVFFEYKIEVLEEQFNLSYLDIHTPGQIYHVDFDA